MEIWLVIIQYILVSPKLVQMIFKCVNSITWTTNYENMHNSAYSSFTEKPKHVITMGAAGMGKRGHLPPSGNVVKCFCALVVTAKRSVDKLFMHYFQKLLLASGASPLAPTTVLSLPPPRFYPWTPLGDLSPRLLICQCLPLEKILQAPMFITKYITYIT